MFVQIGPRNWLFRRLVGEQKKRWEVALNARRFAFLQNEMGEMDKTMFRVCADSFFFDFLFSPLFILGGNRLQNVRFFNSASTRNCRRSPLKNRWNAQGAEARIFRRTPAILFTSGKQKCATPAFLFSFAGYRLRAVQFPSSMSTPSSLRIPLLQMSATLCRN